MRMCMYIKVYLLANSCNSVKARRSAESAVFLRDMLEYKMEYDDVLTSKDSSSTKVLQHRPDYSMHHFDLSAEGTDTRQHAHTHSGGSPGAETPFPDGWRGGGMRGSSFSTSSSAKRNTSMAASHSSIVAPRKYHFESPPVSRRNTGTRTHTRMCTDTQP